MSDAKVTIATGQTFIRDRDLVVGSRVKTWFMPGGTPVLAIRPYKGLLAYLWKEGALIVTFGAMTRSGRLEMTVDNTDFLEEAN